MPVWGLYRSAILVGCMELYRDCIDQLFWLVVWRLHRVVWGLNRSPISGLGDHVGTGDPLN